MLGSRCPCLGWMKVTAIVPNLPVEDTDTGRDFYTGFLGLHLGFDLGWVANLNSTANPMAQMQLVRRDASAPENPAISVHVPDVEQAYAEARSRGYEIVHPLTREPWGVKRFFVRAPDGSVINIVEHDDSEHVI